MARNFRLPVDAPPGNPFGLAGGEYGNPWGWHLGLDFPVQAGTRVHAARAGTVLWAGEFGALGNCIVLQHALRDRTLYAHLSEIYVQVGQRFHCGKLLGLSGNTGQSTGPHLHFEIWVRCGSVDPALDPYGLTREDPTGLPADPGLLLPPPDGEARWPKPADGWHTTRYSGGQAPDTYRRRALDG